MTKPSVYVETSIVSYLTARPSRDLIIAAQQAPRWTPKSGQYVQLVILAGFEVPTNGRF